MINTSFDSCVACSAGSQQRKHPHRRSVEKRLRRVGEGIETVRRRSLLGDVPIVADCRPNRRSILDENGATASEHIMRDRDFGDFPSFAGNQNPSTRIVVEFRILNAHVRDFCASSSGSRSIPALGRVPHVLLNTDFVISTPSASMTDNPCRRLLSAVAEQNFTSLARLT